MEKPLVDQHYILEKMPGKGGWTYVRVPEIPQDRHSWFGWVKVRGFIDSFEFRKHHLMPMGNGQLFLSVRAEIRKKIGKQQGDTVRVILFPDNEPLEIPEEFSLCLSDDPDALRFFQKLTESEQKAYIDWVYSAKKEETRISRLAKTIDRLSKGMKMYDPKIM